MRIVSLIVALLAAVSATNIAFASEVPQSTPAIMGEERLVEVGGNYRSDQERIELLPIEGQPASVTNSVFDEAAKAAIRHAKDLRLLIWQIHSGNVDDPDVEGWFCEPMMVWADGKLVADLSVCAVHHRKMERVTKEGSHGCENAMGSAMYEASRGVFPNGLPLVPLGRLFPRWERVRSYSCADCVAEFKRWRRDFRFHPYTPELPSWTGLIEEVGNWV
jgi:hypothetical protein